MPFPALTLSLQAVNCCVPWASHPRLSHLFIDAELFQDSGKDLYRHSLFQNAVYQSVFSLIQGKIVRKTTASLP